MHATNKSCAGCHQLVDPIGFGLKKFDPVGMRRENLFSNSAFRARA